MTVAAVVLAASPASALADAEGQPRVRRLVDIAWSGGAIPIVVIAPDPDGLVAVALRDAPVTLAEPAPTEAGPVGQIARGIGVATSAVAETDAALVWPARMTWVGPETVTSLIEAHGTDPSTVLRPSYGGQPGWPVLLPIAHLETFSALARDRMPDELMDDLAAAGTPMRALDLGDPGTTHDADTARADLPAYAGPPGPPDGHTHEWGAAVADGPDDAPDNVPDNA